MNSYRITVLVAALLTVPVLARAQDSVPPPPSASAPVPAVDPARLAAARQTIDFIFPTGTYARIMGKSLDGIMSPMMDGMETMPLGSLAGMSGAKPEEIAKLGKGTMADLMAIMDPAYRQRMNITMRVMTAELTGVMSELEPGLRDGLSHAYARRFDLAQLSELNRFFATPTGRAYAAGSMTIMADPDVLAQMQAFMPVLMKRMPVMMSKVSDATANLPKPRKYDELTPADRKRVEALVGQSSAGAATPASQ